MSLSPVTATEPSKFLSKQAAEGKHHQNYPQLGKPRKRKNHFVLWCRKNKLLLLSVPTNIRLSCSTCLPVSSSWFWSWYEPHWGLICHQIGWEMSAVEEVGEDVQRSAAGMKAGAKNREKTTLLWGELAVCNRVKWCHKVRGLWCINDVDKQ